MSNIVSWFLGLSKLGKSAVIGATAVSGYTTSTLMAQPDTSVTHTPATSQRSTAPTKPTVTQTTATEVLVIPYDSTTQKDASLPSGQTKIIQTGTAGSKIRTHTITLTDDQETDRYTVEEITSHPTTQITAVGTYVAPQPTPAPVPVSSTPAQSSAGAVKLSRSGICHAPGTTYYNQTKNYTGYSSLSECLSAGGRMPLR